MNYYFDEFGWLSPDQIEGRHTEIAPPETALSDGYAWNFTGFEWVAAQVQQPAAVVPQIVITKIASDKPTASLIEGVSVATVPEGATLTVTAELRNAATGDVLPMSDTFRMPLHASDGRERVILATMKDGRLSVSVPLRESGVWEISETGINRNIPEENRMQFAGLQLFVVINWGV